jgi:hypothetical protein
MIYGTSRVSAGVVVYIPQLVECSPAKVLKNEKGLTDNCADYFVKRARRILIISASNGGTVRMLDGPGGCVHGDCAANIYIDSVSVYIILQFCFVIIATTPF